MVEHPDVVVDRSDTDHGDRLEVCGQGADVACVSPGSVEGQERDKERV